MTRARNVVNKRKRRKKIIKRAKGYIGLKRKSFKAAKEQVMRSGSFSFEGRKNRKREFRKLFIVRLNNSLKKFDINYSKFIHLISLSHIHLNRKILSEMAINNPENFSSLVEKVINK